jgi:hypothetical protein
MGSLGRQPTKAYRISLLLFSYSPSRIRVCGTRLLDDEPSLDRLAPLLILMGFAGNNTIHTDPIGRLQKVFLIGRHLKKRTSFVRGKLDSIREEEVQEEERGARRETVR